MKLSPLLVLGAPACCLLHFSSCTSISRAIWVDDYMESSTNQTATLSLSHENEKEGVEITIGDAELETNTRWKVSSGGVSLSLPAGSRTGAQRTVRLLDLAEQKVARDLMINRDVRVHFVGIRAPNAPVRKFQAKSTINKNVMQAPFLVSRGVHRAENAFATKSAIFEVIYHELYEYQLMMCAGHPRALPDIGMSWKGIVVRDRMYTRWFRDGFSTYAAHRVVREFDRLRGAPRRDIGIGQKAFTSLAKRRSRLFRWHQFSGRHDSLNYPASLGMFLLLEKKYGMAKMRDWFSEMRKSEIPDGKSILAAAKKVYGKSLPEIVNGWYFPNTIGPFLETVEWEKSGDQKDGLPNLTIDGMAVKDCWSAEMAVFNALERGKAFEMESGTTSLMVPAAP